MKNRKQTIQPIRRELSDELQSWLQAAKWPQIAKLWPNDDSTHSKMLKADLEAAGMAYVDSSGRFADFHALRHTYISLITQGGVHPKLATTVRPAQRHQSHDEPRTPTRSGGRSGGPGRAADFSVVMFAPRPTGGKSSLQLGPTMRTWRTKPPSRNVLPICLPKADARTRTYTHTNAACGPRRRTRPRASRMCKPR